MMGNLGYSTGPPNMYDPAPEGATYEIVRFRFQGENEVIATGKTLEEVQEHCQRSDTRGDGWFDGYREE